VDCSGEDDQCNDGVCNIMTGACEAEPKADSTPCEDGSACTSETGVAQTPDHCESGKCTGIPVDCSGEDDQCNDGVCNTTSGACEAEPKADSTPCEDGSICTSETGVAQTPDHCESGKCTGILVDCSAEDDDCNDGVCNTMSGACEADPKMQGTPCTDDGSVCTDDECDMAGMCTHFTNSAPCDDGNGCTIGDMCVDGMCEPGLGNCETMCRTPGFWGARGGDDKGATNVTQAVIDMNGGMINVCGQVITKTDDIGGLDSALEGLCVNVRRVRQRQLYRQLVAFELNCVISGANNNCDTLVDIASECDSLCAIGSSTEVGVGQCIGALDCFNNGRQMIDGMCAAGTCENQPELFCGSMYGACPAYNDEPQKCVDFPGNCHDTKLCPPEGAFCFEPLRRAGGQRDCFKARYRNDCTIDGCP
jgi:hypothetical protein